jgi:hypothetical protein
MVGTKAQSTMVSSDRGQEVPGTGEHASCFCGLGCCCGLPLGLFIGAAVGCVRAGSGLDFMDLQLTDHKAAGGGGIAATHLLSETPPQASSCACFQGAC